MCRCSQIMNEIPLNTHSYYMTTLEKEVATIGLISFWISVFVCLIKIYFWDFVDENYKINVFKFFVLVTQM